MLGAIFLATPAIPALAAAPAFTESGPISSDAGYALLEWKANGPVTLEMAREADFRDARELYKGPNRSSFVTGLADGDYYLRLRAGTGEESRPLRLTVAHHPLAQALWLAAMGAAIFLAVVAVILRGARDD